MAELETNNNKNKKYKIKAIYNSVVSTKKIRIRLSTRTLLFSFLKKLSRRRKYLRACIVYLTS